MIQYLKRLVTSKLKLVDGDELELANIKNIINDMKPDQLAFLRSWGSMSESMINNIKNLNCGGCGVFALHMSNRLDELGIEHNILASNKYMSEDCWDDQVNDYKNNSSKYLSASHVIIEVYGLLIDGYDMLCPDDDGYIRTIDLSYENPFTDKGSHYGEITGIFHKELLDRSLSENVEGAWNTMYDRSQDKIVKEIINHFI